ncbi:hypothetical protein ACS0TY_008383 [Phlomoides rotata]
MVDSDEEFEPLFDYTRIQPVDVICFDDDLDETPVFCSKKQKLIDAADEKKAHDVKVDVKAIDLDDEEDWLAPPPKILDNGYKALKEDSTLIALRLKRQELASFAQSAEEVVRAVEESVRKDFNAASQSSPKSESILQLEPPRERTKLVISIQDKDGVRHFRVFMVCSPLYYCEAKNAWIIVFSEQLLSHLVSTRGCLHIENSRVIIKQDFGIK